MDYGKTQNPKGHPQTICMHKNIPLLHTNVLVCPLGGLTHDHTVRFCGLPLPMLREDAYGTRIYCLCWLAVAEELNTHSSCTHKLHHTNMHTIYPDYLFSLLRVRIKYKTNQNTKIPVHILTFVIAGMQIIKEF